MSTEVEHIMIIFLFFNVYSLLLGWPHLKLGQLRALPSTWLAMSGFVSVGSTPQTTAIFVCHPHVKNVVLTRRRHSLMSANFSSVGVVSVRPVADTHSCMNVGISINEVVTYEDKKKLECLPPIIGRVVISCHPLRFCHPLKDYTTDKAHTYSK